MKRVILPNKYRAEVLTLLFDFTSQLVPGDALGGTGSPVVTISVYQGVDASPAAMLSGSASNVGNVLHQNVQNGVVGVTYTVRAAASTTGGATLVQQGFLTVMPDQP